MSRVRCLSRNLVSVVCHVHCLSQKFQKIMSRVRCLSWLVKNPRVNNLSRFCHRFVTFLWRLCDVYVRNSFQFVSIRFKTAKTTWGCTLLTNDKIFWSVFWQGSAERPGARSCRAKNYFGRSPCLVVPCQWNFVVPRARSCPCAVVSGFNKVVPCPHSYP